MVVEGEITSDGYLMRKVVELRSQDPGLVKDDAFLMRCVNAGIGTLEVRSYPDPRVLRTATGQYVNKMPDTGPELDMLQINPAVKESLTTLLPIWTGAFKTSRMINILEIANVNVYERGADATNAPDVQAILATAPGDHFIAYPTTRDLLPPAALSEILEAGVVLLSRLTPGIRFQVDQGWWEHPVRARAVIETNTQAATNIANLLNLKRDRIQASVADKTLEEAMLSAEAQWLTSLAVYAAYSQPVFSGLAMAKQMTPRRLQFELERLASLRPALNVEAVVGLGSIISRRDNRELHELLDAIDMYLPILKRITKMKWAPYAGYLRAKSSVGRWTITGVPSYWRVNYNPNLTYINLSGRAVPVMGPIAIPEGAAPNQPVMAPELGPDQAEDAAVLGNTVGNFYKTKRSTSQMISMFETIQPVPVPQVGGTTFQDTVTNFEAVYMGMTEGLIPASYFIPGGGVDQAILTPVQVTAIMRDAGMIDSTDFAFPVNSAVLASGVFEGRTLVTGYQQRIVDDRVLASDDACWPWVTELAQVMNQEEPEAEKSVTFPIVVV